MAKNKTEIRSYFKSISKIILDEIDSRMDNFISPAIIKKYINHYKQLNEDDIELIYKYIELTAEIKFDYYERYKSYFNAPQPVTFNFNASNVAKKTTEVKYKKNIIDRKSPVEKEFVRDESKAYKRPHVSAADTKKVHLSDNPKNSIKSDSKKQIQEKPKQVKTTKANVSPEKVAKKITQIKTNVKKVNNNMAKNNYNNISKGKAKASANNYTWNKVPDLTIEREYDNSILEKKVVTKVPTTEKTKSKSVSNIDKRPNLNLDFKNLDVVESGPKVKTTKGKMTKAQVTPKPKKNAVSNQDKRPNLNLDFNDLNVVETRAKAKPTKAKMTKANAKKEEVIAKQKSQAMKKTNHVKAKAKKSNVKTSTTRIVETKSTDTSSQKTFDKRNIIEFKREYDSSVLNTKLTPKVRKESKEVYTWDKKPKLK